jgi:hypothetical protein
MQGGRAGSSNDQSQGWCYTKIDAHRRSAIAKAGYGNFPEVIQEQRAELDRWLAAVPAARASDARL